MSRVVLLFALSLRLSLVTFVLSIPVAAQQPQRQKPKPTSQADEDQDSVIRVTTNLVQLDVVDEGWQGCYRSHIERLRDY